MKWRATLSQDDVTLAILLREKSKPGIRAGHVADRRY